MKYIYLLILLLLLFILVTSGESQWLDKNPQGTTETLTSICFSSPMKGFATAENHIYKINPFFNLGYKRTFDQNTNFKSVFFLDNSKGFAVGYNSAMNSGVIVLTNNNGHDWSNENQILGNSKLYDVFFINDSIGWVAGKSYSNNHSIIGKTTDGGATWFQSNLPIIDSGILYSIFFTNENTGWAVGMGDSTGFGKMLKSTDAGITWEAQTVTISGSIKDLFFYDENDGWICTTDGEIFKSHDGGQNWQLQFSCSSSINSIRFNDSNFGWAAGNYGSIFRTSDGGTNWIVENAGVSENLSSIAINDRDIVWVCGNNGKLMTRTAFSPGTTLTPIIGTQVWGDYDNDGDMDLALTGVFVPTNFNPNVDQRYSEIHKNNGNGTFTKIPDQIIKVSDGSLGWGDYDNDGDLDLLIAGFYEDDTTANYIAKIYRNDGNDTFKEIHSDLVGFETGFLEWGDLDNDGDLDIISSAGVYRNMGDDIFSELTPVFGGAKVGDLDNDGDLDIIADSPDLKIFVNEGNFSFVETIIPTQKNLNPSVITSALIESSSNTTQIHFKNDKRNSVMEFYGSYDLGDYDNDGDLDILVVSSTGTRIYRNNGNMTFVEPPTIELPFLPTGTGVFGDYDNDGDLDIFLTGGNTYNDFESGIYRNDGNDHFTQLPFYNNDLDVISWASAHWGDYDNDGDLDLIVSGETPHINGITCVYKNNSVIQNEIPSSPLNLFSILSGRNITLIWSKSLDVTTPQEGLNYNIVVGSEPGKFEIVSPMSDIVSGFRRIVTQGNVCQNNTWILKNLYYGRYYWAVQSIDNSFSGSLFSSEKTFAIPYSSNNYTIPTLDTSAITFDSSYVTIRFTTPNQTNLALTVDRFDNSPEGALPSGIENISDTYWSININAGIVDGIFNLILDLSQIEGINNYSSIHLLKRDNDGEDWIDLGVPTDFSNGSTAILWSGLSEFSQFGLGSGPDNPLPVELSFFSATLINNSVKLNWQTETETNNYGFQVERKIGVDDWTNIGFIKGDGNRTTPKQYTYFDNTMPRANKCNYRLQQLDLNGSFKYSSEVEVLLNPAEFELSQNYPNPFNPSTKIRYQIPEAGKVVIKIYNILGAEVIELVNEKKDAGVYEVHFNAQNLPSGTYIYTMVANNFTQTKKMILLK